MAEEPKKKLYRSAHGVVTEVSEKAKYLEAKIMEGSGYAKTVRAFSEENKQALRAAALSGEKTLVTGTIEQGFKTLAVYAVNKPDVIRGRVSNVRHSEPGKQVAINGFIQQDITAKDGSIKKIGKPFRLFGDAVHGLEGLKAGDIIEADARQLSVARGTDENRVFIDALEILGNGRIVDPSLGAGPEERQTNIPPVSRDVTPDNEIGSDPFPPSDWDDEIPF